MATERRDIELAIRARDLSTADLRRVQTAVDNLARGIEAQARAAQKGEISTAELRVTLDELRQAGAALASQQGLIDTFNRISAALAKTEQEAEQAKAALNAFSAETAKTATLTEKQVQQQNNLAAALAKAKANADAAKTALATFNAGIREGEQLTEKQAAQQAKLAARVDKTAASLDAAQKKSTEFAASVERINAEKAANDQQRLERAATNTARSVEKQRAELEKVSTALKAASIDTNNLADAQQRILNTARQVGTAQTALGAAISAAPRNAREAAEAAKLQVESERAAKETQRSIEQFRALADQAERTAQGFASLSSQARSAAQVTSTLDQVLQAQGNLASVNTTRRRTLGGIEEVAETASARIQQIERARGPVQGYVETLQDLERTAASVQRQAKQVDGFVTQQRAVELAERASREANAELARLTTQVRNAAAPNRELAEQMNRAALNARAAGQALVEQRARLSSLQNGLEETGVDTRNLADAQQRLAAVAQTTTQSIQRLNAVVAQRGVSEADRFGLFGLRPFEIQNLAFQVNDFFTQIASGTSVTQAFAQQIGQVVQVGRVGSFLLAQLPAILAFGTAIGITAAAISRFVQQLNLLRAAAAAQTFGGGFDPEVVLRAARAAQQLGLGFAEAREAALAFARLPINLDQYRQLVDIVANLSVVGRDAKQETERLTEAIKGGTAGILKYDEEFGRLSASQRDYIANAQTQEERTRALTIFLDTYTTAARRAREEATTPLGEAFRELRNSWQGFLDSLAGSGAVSALTLVVNGLTAAVGNLSAGLRALPGLIGNINVASGAVEEFFRRRARAAGSSGPPQGRPETTGGFSPDGRDLLTEDAARLRREQDDASVKAAQERAAAAQREADNRRRAALAGQTAISTRERLAAIEEEIAKGTERGANAAQRRASVDAARRKAEEEFRREFPTADDDSIRRAGVLGARQQQQRVDEAAQRDAERGARAGLAERRQELEGLEQDLQRLEQARSDLFRQIQEDVQRGTITSTEGLDRIRQVAERLAPRFAEVARAAKEFAAANRGTDVLRDARADALTIRADRLSGQGSQQQAGNQLLTQQRTQLQQAVQERTAFIQTINALEQQGAITTFEAQQRIRDAYALTNETITAQITELERLTAAALDNGQISQVQAAAIRAQIELARAQLVFIDPAVAKIRQTIEQVGTQQIGNAFGEIADQIGRVVTGFSSLGEAAEESGRIVLRMFANILKAIAQTIIQQQILNAIQAVSRALGFTTVPTPAAAPVPSRRLGGIVGQRNNAAPRRVNPAWFIGAPHYQTGGFPGLRADEEAAILHRGEEVLTKDDPRNMLNMMKGGGETVSPGEIAIRNVLLVDPSTITDAMTSSAGERVTLATVKKNAAAIKSILGV